jgi:hypothetical protein
MHDFFAIFNKFINWEYIRSDLPHKDGSNTLRIVLTIRLTIRTIRNKYLTILQNTRVTNPQSG